MDNKWLLGAICAPFLALLIGFLFSSSMVSKADCINIVDKSIKEHELRDEKRWADFREDIKTLNTNVETLNNRLYELKSR